MLKVITMSEAEKILRSKFKALCLCETVPLSESFGRVLAEDIIAGENIPPADRSMVDGYAVRACDTFGASESIPALLHLQGEIAMGEMPSEPIKEHCCMKIPTGGFLPKGADAAVMIEHTDLLPDGTVCIRKPAAPGSHLAFCGDDMRKGQHILKAGSVIDVGETGTLAAMGQYAVPVTKKVKVALFSTGDEITEIDKTVTGGQMRDVNRHALKALIEKMGGTAEDFGIILDDEEKLREAVIKGAESCDMVIFSGGTSAGARDFAEKVLSEEGEILWHGIAVKPGKPTLASSVLGKPVLALPGHPMAACLIFMILGKEALCILEGRESREKNIYAEISQSVSANDGRELILPVHLSGEKAEPIRSKSGLITKLSEADGYVIIGRNCEGIHAGEKVKVTLF